MKLDQLTIDEQKTATHCHTCGEVRTGDELGLVLDRCEGRCSCPDNFEERIAHMDAVIAEIDGLLAKRRAAVDPVLYQKQLTQEAVRNRNRFIRACAALSTTA